MKTLELTEYEINIMSFVLKSVKNNLVEDEETGGYVEDYNSWRMNIEAVDYAALEDLVEKVQRSQ